MKTKEEIRLWKIMKTKEEIRLWKIIAITSLILSIAIFSYYNWVDPSEEIYKIILKADSDLSEISIIGQKAVSYYTEASYAYEDGDYKKVESNCRLAREYYYQEGQGYKRVKAELNDKEIDDKLIVLYIEQLNLLSEITNNMFEACEYFESAARYYEIYYNTDVPYDDMSYYMGDGEIEMMNEKIRDHDNAVEKYNNKIEEFGFELEKRLK